MKVTVLSSGSKGNSTLVSINDKNILIDAGLSLSNLRKRIEGDFPKIDVLIITHSHTDHTKGISSVLKEYKPLLLTKSDEVISNYKDYNILSDDELSFSNISIKLLALSHDAPCTGVIIKEEDKELVYITDTGYINRKVLKQIENKDIYIMESNHDVNMLRNGKYPFFLQQRILGDKGHLSNYDCCSYLQKVIGNNTKYIILAHLSEENNTEELVMDTSYPLTKRVNKLFIAKQDKSIDTVEV